MKGTFNNLLNILLLAQKNMRTNPINLILTGIAVADFLLSVEYIPFNAHMYLPDESSRDPEELYSIHWGIFLLFHTNFTIMIHNVSVCLTLSLAIWRLIMIRFPALSVHLCTLVRCRSVLITCYGSNFLLFSFI